MHLVPRDPFFHDPFEWWNDSFFRETDTMKSDLYQKDGNYVLKVDMPGVAKENIVMNYDNGYLTIAAHQETEEEIMEDCIRKERFYGEYRRSYYVGDIDEEAIKANYVDGTLTVTFPKEKELSETPKKQIPID